MSGASLRTVVDVRTTPAVDTGMFETFEIDTPTGTARAQLSVPGAPPVGVLVLGHGAGGGVQAPDLVAVAAASVAAGWCTVLLEQPWKVAGRRIAPAPPRLDQAWVPAVAEVRRRLATKGPLVVGGRSAGARVACRTASATGAAGVVCLAFPLHPPGRPERSRLAELISVQVPVLVVQGRRDAFGTAQELRAVAPDGVAVVAVDGDHRLAAGAVTAAEAVSGWLCSRSG
jgi:uncharacterized protein